MSRLQDRKSEHDEMKLGGGGLSGVYGDPSKAPGADEAGPAIMPGVPGMHWWKKPVYETPEWWRERGWPIPSRQGAVITTIVGVAAVLLAVQVQRQHDARTQEELAQLDALVERCVNDPTGPDCPERDGITVDAFRDAISPPEAVAQREYEACQRRFGDDCWIYFDVETGQWRSSEQQRLRECLLPSDPCGYRSGTVEANALSTTGTEQVMVATPQFTDAFIQKLEAADAGDGPDQERIEAFLADWEAGGSPNPFRELDRTTLPAHYQSDERTLDFVLTTPYGRIPTIDEP